MSGMAVFMLCLSITLVWGGFVASIFFLRARSEVPSYPDGGRDDERDGAEIIEHDT